MSRNCLGFFLKNNLIEELEIWRTVISCTSRSSLRNGPKIKLLSEKIVLLTNWYESYLFGFFGEKQLIWHFFSLKTTNFRVKKLTDSDFVHAFEERTKTTLDENAIDLWIKISNSRQFSVRNQNQRTESQIWKVLNFVGFEMWKIVE